ncbi:hypothetical protein [uncultured Bacteroides sp.]
MVQEWLRNLNFSACYCTQFRQCHIPQPSRS